MSKKRKIKSIKKTRPIFNSSYTSTVKVLLIITIFAFVSSVGLSIIKDKYQSNIKNSIASAMEPADFDNNNKVDVFDLAKLLAKWNTNDSMTDIKKDGIVNIGDLSLLLSKWGPVDVTPPPPPSANQKPDTNNTGVPIGQNLVDATTDLAKGIEVSSNGNVKITKPGTFTNLRIKGLLNIASDNVTLRYVRVDANPTNLPADPTTNTACVAIFGKYNWNAITTYDRNNILIEDSEIIQAKGGSAFIGNGIHGSGYTLRRVEIAGTVDGAGMFRGPIGHTNPEGDVNAKIENSLIHNLHGWQYDPNGHEDRDAASKQVIKCNPTHSDGLQIHYGKNMTIINSTLMANTGSGDGSNAAIQITQGKNHVSNVKIENNWLDYGGCSLNIYDNYPPDPETNPAFRTLRPIKYLSVKNNKFGKNMYISSNPSLKCAMTIDIDTQRDATNINAISGNVWEDGSTPPPSKANASSAVYK